MARRFGVRTVLIAADDAGLRDALSQDLQHDGYLVLTARMDSEAIEIVRVHSRAIDLMLIDEGAGGRTLATTLKQYRPDIKILFLTQCSPGSSPDASRSGRVVARVRELLATAVVMSD